jgi:3',5'-cyclic AMP phosphodiesterase CpdA
MPTIAHISDLHLQSGVPERQAQVEPIIEKINEIKPDAVIISGDVTDDGWDSIEELKWAEDWLGWKINATCWILPGNHDVGNFVNAAEGAIDLKRINHWDSVFGGDLDFEFDRWNLLGINSMRFGMTGSETKFDIYDIESFLYDCDGTNKWTAIFLHTPFFAESIDENDPAIDYWVGPKEPRQKLWSLINSCKSIKLIGSGHLHQTRLTEIDGVKIAWAPPASGTWVHAPGLPNPPMPQQTGFFLHTLHDDGRVESELIECAPMLKLYEHKP